MCASQGKTTTGWMEFSRKNLGAMLNWKMKLWVTTAEVPSLRDSWRKTMQLNAGHKTFNFWILIQSFRQSSNTFGIPCPCNSQVPCWLALVISPQYTPKVQNWWAVPFQQMSLVSGPSYKPFQRLYSIFKQKYFLFKGFLSKKKSSIL